MPTIAVTRADIPHENFGEITRLAWIGRSVDPKANRKNTRVQRGRMDANLPRPLSMRRTRRRRDGISQRIGELAERVDPYFRSELQRMQYGQGGLSEQSGGQEGVVQWAMDHYGLKAAYLEEQGDPREARHQTAGGGEGVQPGAGGDSTGPLIPGSRHDRSGCYRLS